MLETWAGAGWTSDSTRSSIWKYLMVPVTGTITSLLILVKPDSILVTKSLIVWPTCTVRSALAMVPPAASLPMNFSVCAYE